MPKPASRPAATAADPKITNLIAEGLQPLATAWRDATGIAINPKSLRAYVREGLRGAVLESLLVGGVRCTSTAAVLRFVAASQRPEVARR